MIYHAFQEIQLYTHNRFNGFQLIMVKTILFSATIQHPDKS